MSDPVLDASALLVLLNAEPGAEVVTECIPGALICSVNLSEVVAKLAEAGMPEGELRACLTPLGLEVIPFDEALAYRAGLLRPLTSQRGLSLGDRACLALGLARELPVLTADRSWEGLPFGQIRLVR